MQNFKRKTLYLALVAAASSVGITQTASAAVNVNANGLGEVLIYPYYTTRAGTTTTMSVVNTTNSAKAVKVRFTEGRNSREVLDFNLYLSPNDVWTSAVINTKNGAKIITQDTSCTFPAIPKLTILPDGTFATDSDGFVLGGADFKDSIFKATPIVEGFEGIGGDGGNGEFPSLDRTREGYIEIIEMGEITNTAIKAAVTHNSNGVPANCSVVQTKSMDMSGSFPSNPNATVKPNGGLAGGATLINVANGTDFSYDPVVLDSFALGNLWNPAGTILPDLTQGIGKSVVFHKGQAVTSDWGSFGEDAVSAVLMHDHLINEYVLDSKTVSGTDWVVTMPTKRYYVPVDNPSTTGTGFVYSAINPFTKTFWTNGACEPVGLNYWDREEKDTNVVDFSPPEPDGGAALCWEANVITFNGSSVLGSHNETQISSISNQNGWLRMTFNDPGHIMISTDGDTYKGLPTVGFMLQDFGNGNVNGLLSNYGGNFNHKYTTDIFDNPNPPL